MQQYAKINMLCSLCPGWSQHFFSPFRQNLSYEIDSYLQQGLFLKELLQKAVQSSWKQTNKAQIYHRANTTRTQRTRGTCKMCLLAMGIWSTVLSTKLMQDKESNHQTITLRPRNEIIYPTDGKAYWDCTQILRRVHTSKAFLLFLAASVYLKKDIASP